MMIPGSCVGESCVDVQSDVAKAKVLKIRRSPDSGAVRLSETLINDSEGTGDHETAERKERWLSYSAPGECVRFISPEVYRSNRQKYLRSYTFHRTDEEEEEDEGQEDANMVVKKHRKWFKNLRNSMKMKKIKKKKKKKNNKNRDSIKSCSKFLFCCFCQY